MPRRRVSAQELSYYRTHFLEALREDGVVCLECGAIRQFLGHHMGEHHMTIADYREKWGYNRRTALVTPAISAALAQRARAQGLAERSPPGSLAKAVEASRRLNPSRRPEGLLRHGRAARARIAAGWRPSQALTKVTDGALKGLVEEGLTFAQMAAGTGLDRSSLRRRTRRLGLMGPGIAPREPRVGTGEVLALRAAGMGPDAIAARTGLSRNAVNKRLRRLRQRGVSGPPTRSAASRALTERK